MTAPNINMFWAEMVTDELVHRGVTTFCVSPGSRSTPLTLAVADHPRAEIKVNLDERGSAFYAVGYARATGRAAAVICTSGTAVANMLPAVIEAYHSRLPITVLTADRPEELQNCGANQTINQGNIFGQYAVAGMTIEAPTDRSDPIPVLKKLDATLKVAPATAPVHINFRFREPLAPVEEAYDHNRMQQQLDQWQSEMSKQAPPDQTASAEKSVSEIASLIDGKAKGLIIAGPETPFRASRMIGKLSEKLKWPIVSDILSQQRHIPNGHVIAHYDLYLDIEKIAEILKPEVILHIGGLPTSKRLNQFFLQNKGVEYLKLQDHNRTIDPDTLETKRIVCQPDRMLDQIITQVAENEKSEYLDQWADMDNRCGRFINDYFDQGAISEPQIANRLGASLTDGDALFLSSSMPIRDADSFIPHSIRDIFVGSNRGASGIDGVIASTCGFAAGSMRPTFLLIGDLAFIHDLNSLALAKKSDVPVIIIVINNNGGGIFHFLPVAGLTDHFENIFATPHGLSFENAAGLFDLPYHNPKRIIEFDECLKQTRADKHSAVIEIVGDRVQNIKEHENLREQLWQRLQD